MPFGRNEDTGMELIAILLIGFILLLLVFLLLQNLGNACPQGTVQCDASVSACGCCVEDGLGNLVEYCEAGVCPSGYSLDPNTGRCCDVQNPSNCITNQEVCVNPLSCSLDSECCNGWSCENGECAPCESGLICDPQDPDSCCSNYVCSEEGRCESCANQQCSLDSDCCEGYECNNGLCTSCERVCNNDQDCCNGWNCEGGVCASCYRLCGSDIDCCNGDACFDGSCLGCEQGAYCDENKPCCDGYQCNLQTNTCDSCDRQCTLNEQCCEGGVCSEGICVYPQSCEGFACSNPGEPCRVCSGNDCVNCEDDTVCAWDSTLSKFTCQSSGNCGEGQVACEDTDCPSGCCDALSGECSVCAVGHACETIEGCTCCTEGTQNIVTCPQGTFLCEGYGCMVSSLECQQIGSAIICTPSALPSCPQGTFECSSNPDTCCMYVVPMEALPEEVSLTTSDVCPSGYKLKQVQGFGIFNAPSPQLLPTRRTLSCCNVSYEKRNNYYQYAFSCDGDVYFGRSQVSPYEYMVYTTKVLPQSYCTEIALQCPPNEQCFIDPVVIEK